MVAVSTYVLHPGLIVSLVFKGLKHNRVEQFNVE